MSQPRSIVAGFFVKTLAWMVPALTVWYLARNYVVVPVAWLAEWAMHSIFPGWVSGSELHGVDLTLVTRLAVAHPSGQWADLTPEVSVLTYCYGTPLLVALLLAARARQLWWKVPTCALVLLPFQAWGVCFAWLVPIAVEFGQHTRATTYFSPTTVNLIGLGYQLGFLLFPTLVPMLLWMYLERRFIITVAAEGSLEGALGT